MARKKCFARLACVPNLRLDGLPIYRESPARKICTDGRHGVDIEFSTSEPQKDWVDGPRLRETFETCGLRGHVLFLLVSSSPHQHGRNAFRA